MMFIAGLLATAILAFSGVGFAVAAASTANLNQIEVFDSIPNRVPDDGGTNILLVGSDNRDGLSREDRLKYKLGLDDFGRQTDTILIAHIADDGSVGLVSIPRDSLVTIPAHTSESGTSQPETKNKINAAYSLGGAPLLVETVEQNTNVHIDHYAEISFLGFVDIVDSLGGVPVCTKVKIRDKNSGLKLNPGTTDVDGQQALAYVRARYFDPTADIGRIERQQTFLGSLFKTATSPSTLLNPFRTFSFLRSTTSSITVDEGMNRQEIFNLISQVGAVSPGSMSFTTVPVDEGHNEPGVGSVVTWKQPQADEIFAKLQTGAALSSKDGSTKVPTVEVAPSSIRVSVFNGTKTPGLGTKVQSELTAEGFATVGVPQDAQTKTDGPVIIQYDPEFDTSLKTLEAALPGAETQAVEGLGATFKVIAGPDFKGVTPVKVKSSSGSSGNDNDNKTAADDICA